MRSCVVRVKGVSPISFSRYIKEGLKKGEDPDGREHRIWKDKLHVDNGHVVVPPMMIKKSIDGAAHGIKEKIKGKGNTTWIQAFKAGVLVTEPLVLPVKLEDVACEEIFADAQGKKGGGRVSRLFPTIREWGGEFTAYVLNDSIESERFERYIDYAGKFVGWGRFRPANGGYYGRFTPTKFEWGE